MRFLMYAKTDGVENLFYDSESCDPEMAIAQPNLKLELSKAGTLEFTILSTHPMYDSFKTLKTYIRVVQDDTEIFRGRVLKIQDSIWMERNVQCEGDLAYLIDSLQPPQQSKSANSTSSKTTNNDRYRTQYGGHTSAKSTDVQTLELGTITNTKSLVAEKFQDYIQVHNSQMEIEKQFTVGNITVVDVGTVSFTASSYRDTKNSIDSDLVSRYGGYLQTRPNPNGPTFIDWLKEPGIVSTQNIVLGMNLVDLQREIEGNELFTIFVPIGDNDTTIASVNNGNIGLEDPAKIAKYGKIYKTERYSGIKDPEELMKMGQDYMSANCRPEKLSLDVKALDMNLLDGSIDAIRVGSTVNVVSDPHGVDVSLTCISIEYDIQNPENNSYEIGDASETLSHKAQLANAATAEATSSARSSAGWASSAASDLGDTITRHAQNIIDQADLSYKLEADLAQVHAKCIEITAEEKVTVTADTIDVNAKGAINLTSEGTISMDASSLINFANTLFIGAAMDPYTLYNLGEAWMQELTIGGHLHIADIEDENGAKWTDTSSLRGFLSIFSSSFIYGNEENGQNLENAVKSFGAAIPDSTGQISIPYYTFSGGDTKAGDITFNMADTAWFIMRAVKSLIATQEGNIIQTGNSVSAMFRLHAKNADGDDITSQTQEISLEYAGGTVKDLIATKESNTSQTGNEVKATFRLHAKNDDGDDITSKTQEISLEFKGVEDLNATQESTTSQSGHIVSATFLLHAKDDNGEDILSKPQVISLVFDDTTINQLIAIKDGDTTQHDNTVSAPFTLHAKDANGNDIKTGTQTISLDFLGVKALTINQESNTSQGDNTVTATFRLHAKDINGDDITSVAKDITLEFNGVKDLNATQESTTSQSGNIVSATFLLHGKDANGEDILSKPQVISLVFDDIVIDQLTATKDGETRQQDNTVSALFTLHAKDADGNDIKTGTQTISLDFLGVKDITVTKESNTSQTGNEVKATFRLHAKDINGDDLISTTKEIALEFNDVTVDQLTATKNGDTTQHDNTVSAPFTLHAKDADGNDIKTSTQTISLDFRGVKDVVATKETTTSQSGNTVSATYRLHAKDENGNDLTSKTQLISLDFNDDDAYRRGWANALSTVKLDPDTSTTISSKKTVYAKARLTPDDTGFSVLQQVDITPSSGGGSGGGTTVNFRATPNGTVLAKIPNGTALTSVHNGNGFTYRWMPVKYTVDGTLTEGYVDAEFIMYANAYKNRKAGTSTYPVTNTAPSKPYTYVTACLVDI